MSLHAALDHPTQTHLAVGAGSAMLVAGWCFHEHERIVSLAVVINGERVPVTYHGLLRLDVQPIFPALIGHTGAAITSGFRTVVPLSPTTQAQTADISLEATLASGMVLMTPSLKQIHLLPYLEADVSETSAPIVICMPTYNPDLTIFRMQIDSIRTQTVSDWLCLIQDDASEDAVYQQVCAMVADDARFEVRRNAHNLGPYLNYERVLSRVPSTADYVMLCSHDNVWDAALLDTLRQAFTPDVTLVASDMRVIDREGTLISPTFWDERTFEARFLDRLIMANTVSGASCMFRGALLPHILPFPPPSDLYDDHWVAMVALTQGEIAFLPQPLVSYRHHGENVIGWVNMQPLDLSILIRHVRAWSAADVPTREWQQMGLDLAAQTLSLSHKRVWATILSQRLTMTSDKQAQLDRIIRADESPRALVAAIRAYPPAPRVVLNLDWLLVYALAVERLLARYGQQYWPHLQLTQHDETRVSFSFGRQAARPRLAYHDTIAAQRSIYQQVITALNDALQAEKDRLTIENQTLHAALTARDAELKAVYEQLASLQQHAQALSGQIQQLADRLADRPQDDTAERELAYIQSRRAWRALQGWYRLKARVLPTGSRRERAYHLLRTTTEIGTQQGMGALAHRMSRWLRGERRYHIAEKTTHPAPLPEVSASSIPIEQLPVDEAPRLYVAVDSPMSTELVVGAGSGLFLSGWVFHTHAPIIDLTLIAGLRRYAVKHTSLVRPDVARAYPQPAARHGGVVSSGFRTAIPLDPVATEQTLTIELEAVLQTGEIVRQVLHTMTLLPYNGVHYKRDHQGEAPLAVVCMATYNPDRAFFRQQIESIRAQTYGNWLCLIQDDVSNPGAWRMMQDVVGDDPRFQLVRNPRNLGIYRNFEACLLRVPAEAAYIAFSDQDDIWAANKLEMLIAAMTPERVFVYSDQTIINARGNVISETGWIERRHQETDLDRLLLANHIAGSACLFRASLLNTALPFPPPMIDLYHDHWMASVALTQGEIGFVETPLIRYRQHGHNAIAWANFTPPTPDQFVAPLRRWLLAHDDMKADLPTDVDFRNIISILCEIGLWADILHRRAPDMPPHIASQLKGVMRMDGQPRLIRAWARERGGVPRITLNAEWRMLYCLVAEQALMRYARDNWQRFTSPSSSPQQTAYDGLRYQVGSEQPVPPNLARLLPPPPLMIHVQEDTDPARWHRTGGEFLHYSRTLAGLRPRDAVLDIGCGAGRMAMAFARYLEPAGRYEGFDVHEPSIAWAQQAYRQPFPHFRFQYLDVANRVYNPQGAEDGTRLRFPYDDATFDLTLLTSIFTHMLPREVAHYWQEIARTLKPGGHALVTAFLLTDESRRRLAHPRNTIPLPYHHGRYRVQSDDEPERVVAYDARSMSRMIAQAGLTLVEVYDGAWCGRRAFLSYQDVMIVQRSL